MKKRGRRDFRLSLLSLFNLFLPHASQLLQVVFLKNDKRHTGFCSCSLIYYYPSFVFIVHVYIEGMMVWTLRREVSMLTVRPRVAGLYAMLLIWLVCSVISHGMPRGLEKSIPGMFKRLHNNPTKYISFTTLHG